MTPRQLLRGATLYTVLLAACSLTLVSVLGLNRNQPPSGPHLVSMWRRGERVARHVVDAPPKVGEFEEAGATRVVETIRDSAPIPGWNRLFLGLSVAPNRDGVSATWSGKTAYATPDDLRKLEAYERSAPLAGLQVPVGVDAERVLALLGRELGASPDELLRHARFRRFAVQSDAPYPSTLGTAELTPERLRQSVLAAARYLQRNQLRDGSFHYERNAVSGEDEPGYSFPRHAGAASFLARTASKLGDAPLERAARRAAVYMRDRTTLRCGSNECIGEGDYVDVGSSALGLLTYVELVEGGAEEFRAPALALAAFLRSQQRGDGDFKHFYDLTQNHAVDEQVEYYTGEAALALSRVHRLSNDPRDLDAARRTLSFLVTRSPWFVTARYFWGAEHWTCQALEDLWQRAPDPSALRFCLAWQAVTRELQLESPAASPEYDGGLSRGPFITPRLTPLASRMEAAVATLAVARRAGVPAREVEVLEREIQRAFGFLLRYQFAPGPTHLMPNARAIAGGFPGSPIDLHVRIDYPQHTGAALLRYWELTAH